MTYSADEFDWTGDTGVALNGHVYHDFYPSIVVDGMVFTVSHTDKDEDHWVTAIHYVALDGRKIVAYMKDKAT